MKISPVNIYYYKKQPSFKAADVNVLSFSDTHGLDKFAGVYGLITSPKQDLLIPKGKNDSNKNVILTAGDIFMDPADKLLSSDGEQPVAKDQVNIFNHFVDTLEKNASENNKAPVSTYFTLGNHDPEGGIDITAQILQGIKAKTVITNLKREETDPRVTDKTLTQDIIEVNDDKDPDKKHKILVLGITTPGMLFYVPSLEGKLTVMNGLPKGIRDKNLTSEQIAAQLGEPGGTKEKIQEAVDKFRDENPNGAVILMNHAGENIGKYLAENIKIDLIPTGHDHYTTPPYQHPAQKGRWIINLGEGERINQAKIHFDDEGKYSIKTETKKVKGIELSQNPVGSYIHNLFERVSAPNYKIEDKKLPNEGVRYDFSNGLANFLTDLVYDGLVAKGKKVNAVGIPGTSFRKALPVDKPFSLNNIGETLKGLQSDQSELLIGDITGKQIREILKDGEDQILQKDGLKSSSALQWSGIKIPQYQETSDGHPKWGVKMNEVTIRNDKGNFEPLNDEKKYTIALPYKLTQRCPLPNLSRIVKNDSFKPSGVGVHELIMDGIAEKYSIKKEN